MVYMLNSKKALARALFFCLTGNQRKPDRNARILRIYQNDQLASPWTAFRPAISIELSDKLADIEAGNVQEYSSTFSIAPPIVPCFSKCVHWNRRKPAVIRRPIHFPCCSLVSLFIVSTTLLSLGDSARDSDFRARLPFSSNSVESVCLTIGTLLTTSCLVSRLSPIKTTTICSAL